MQSPEELRVLVVGGLHELAVCGGESYNIASYGALGDGATDDTQAIRGAIAGTPKGESLFFPPPAAHYRVSGSLTLNKSIRLESDNSAIRMVNDDNLFNVTSSGVTIGGLSTTGASQSGGSTYVLPALAS